MVPINRTLSDLPALVFKFTVAIFHKFFWLPERDQRFSDQVAPPSVLACTASVPTGKPYM
ncbi:MAG: hypothetical protein BWY09_00765 [Candidatus Hydrogenedentes bacterium ADurb.Bin179]|nr:MAG: hypothetical protein BWY09_00765 [Candidatus Hydrogenedentes bacterium ADurb.Bin179]